MSGKMYLLQLGVCQHTITDPISYADAGNSHTDHETLHRNLPLYAVKKQKKNSNFIKSQDSDWRRIDKGLVYPNACCIITATTICSNTA
jgi:hypothetical protein